MPADVAAPAALTRRGLLRYSQLLVVFGAFAAMGATLLAQQAREVGSQADASLRLLGTSEAVPGGRRGPSGCLVIFCGEEELSQTAASDIQAILRELSVEATYVDVAHDALPDLSPFGKVVLAVEDLSRLGASLGALMSWVHGSGQLMVFIPPDPNSAFQTASQQLGIRESATDWYTTPGVRFVSDLMLGGRDHDFVLTEPFESTLPVALDDACRVHAVSADAREVPLVWECERGAGRVVFCNLRVVEKHTRGMFAQAFGLLGPSFAWPVIDGSAFYLDDFPSPVPGGSGEYIERDFGTSVSNFYTDVWWPDLSAFARTYGIAFTGLVIEDYNDTVSPPFARQQDVSRFQYFAGELLRLGGELGVHGYNHMPLVTKGSLEDIDGYETGTYEELYDGYDYWPSEEDMTASLAELDDFMHATFAGNEAHVYVPPSNILSAPGRAALLASPFDVRAIASIYFESAEHAQYVQDFGVADDGVVNTPRIISGGQIDDYMKLCALSELNLHFVSSHFMHPDDMLDPDRGAVQGWRSALANIYAYAEWLYAAAPQIRNLTGTELAAAVQRWSDVCVSTSDEPDAIVLTLEGLHDEACLFVRSRATLSTGSVSGGSVERLDGSLYLVRAREATVRIPKEEA